jgi:RHS repeat-associated protein
MTDGTGTTSYTYDNANQLLSVTAPVTGTVTYTYDALGRRASLLYPGQSTPVKYAYTSRGQLDTVTDWLSNVTDYGYDAAGRLTSIDYPNGVVGTLGYDNADRLTSLDYVNGGTTLEAIDYTLNAAGIRTQMVDSTGTTIWGYDALDRLTSVDYPSGDDVAYTYDAVGNRETLTVGTVTSDYSYNSLNQLTAIDQTDDGSDDITYGYDANGNQTSKNHNSITTAYGWDALNRLTSVTNGGSSVASYVYNGDGLRTRKVVGASTTDFTWDPTGLATVIHVADGTVDDTYLWGAGLLGRIDDSGAETYAHSDGLGSIRAISDGSGIAVGTTAYEAFAATRAKTGVSYAFGFTGEQLDAESGYIYLRARYSDPGTGRFVSRDPFIGFVDIPETLHPYGYARNTPTMNVDPSGLTDMLDPGSSDSYGPGGSRIGPGMRPGSGGNNTPGQSVSWGTWGYHVRYGNVVTVEGRQYAVIGGRYYTRHAIDHMTPWGYGGRWCPPSVVEATIMNPNRITFGWHSPSRSWRTTYHGSGVDIVTEQHGRIIVTIIPK